jgi:hypothetical protein
MNVEWAFLAYSALGGSSTSALGIGFDSFPSFPIDVVPEHARLPDQVGTIVKFAVVIRFLAKRVEGGTPHDVKVAVSDADGAQVTQVKSNIVPQINPNLPQGWDQSIISSFDLAIVPKKFGHYSLDIIIDNDHKKQIPFRILQVPAPPVSQQPGT